MPEIIKTTRLIIFAKKPISGNVKTRLIPELGAENAAKLAQLMLDNTVLTCLDALKLAPKLNIDLCIAPDASDFYWNRFNYSERFILSQQANGNLGDRLSNAAKRYINAGERVLLMGTDCPELNAELLITAAEQLNLSDTAIHPTEDGGYAVLALKKYDDSLFHDIPWSTEKVATISIEKIKKCGFSLAILSTLHDIDEPQDLKYLPTNYTF